MFSSEAHPQLTERLLDKNGEAVHRAAARAA